MKENFEGKEIVVTLKMDGENWSLYKNYKHPRSLNFIQQESNGWLDNFHNRIKNDIHDNWRICGECLYNKHSIFYNNLRSYFYGICIFDENNIALSWSVTVEYFKLMNIFPVVSIFRGLFNYKHIRHLHDEYFNGDENEGFVIRLKDEIKYDDFSKSFAKYVRENHVKTDKHWKYSEKTINKISNNGIYLKIDEEELKCL